MQVDEHINDACTMVLAGIALRREGGVNFQAGRREFAGASYARLSFY
jgi:hypothetical protein